MHGMSTQQSPRYLGRQYNADDILYEGYEANPTELLVSNVETFRKSICDNLTKGVLAGGSIATIESVPTGFRVVPKPAPTSGVQRIKEYIYAFEFPNLPEDGLSHLKNKEFLQAIAQFLVLSFIQLFVDFPHMHEANAMIVKADKKLSDAKGATESDPTAKEAKKNAVAKATADLDAAQKAKTNVPAEPEEACKKAIALAQLVVTNPKLVEPDEAVEATPGTRHRNMFNKDDKKNLLKAVTGVLQTLGQKYENELQVTTDGDEIIIKCGTPSVVIDMKDVDNIEDIIIYNASIAATVLFATRGGPGGTKDIPGNLDKLKDVLAGYKNVVNGIAKEADNTRTTGSVTFQATIT